MNLQVGSPTPSSYARVLYWDTTLHDDHQAKKLLAPYIDPESASDLSCCDPALKPPSYTNFASKALGARWSYAHGAPPKKGVKPTRGLRPAGVQAPPKPCAFGYGYFFGSSRRAQSGQGGS